MADFEENGERLRLSIDVPAEHLEGLKAYIGEFAAQRSFEIKPVTESIQTTQLRSEEEFVTPEEPDTDFKDRRPAIHPSGLFEWVFDPETGEEARTITSETIVNFGASIGKQAQARRLFSSLALGVKDKYSPLGSYSFIGIAGDDIPRVGIREISALELARRLLQAKVGDQRADDLRGIKGVGPWGIGFFEEYCRALFPHVAMPFAMQELDLAALNKKLGRSKIRKATWGWVGAQATGESFASYDLVSQARIYGGNEHLNELQKLGLITRRPSKVGSTLSLKDLNAPFHKLADRRWDDLRELLAGHDALPSVD